MGARSPVTIRRSWRREEAEYSLGAATLSLAGALALLGAGSLGAAASPTGPSLRPVAELEVSTAPLASWLLSYREEDHGAATMPPRYWLADFSARRTVVLDVGAGEARWMDRLPFGRGGSGRVATTVPSRAARLEAGAGGELVVVAGERRYRIRLRPEPVGEIERRALLRRYPAYGARAAGLRAAPEPRPEPEGAPQIEIVAFFGGWCEACLRAVPRLLAWQSQRAGRDGGPTVRYVAVPAEGGAALPLVRAFGVGELPTAVVLRAGTERLRLVGIDGWRKLEVRLRDLATEEPGA